MASNASQDIRRLALAAMPRVCRTGTHLFQFVAACKELRGWGRGLREAVAGWYNDKPLDKLAYQVTKYRHRAGYTHRDTLRLSHPKTNDGDRNRLYGWIVKGGAVCDEPGTPLGIVAGLSAAESIKAGDDRTMARVIGEYGLTLEHVPNTFLSSPKVWDALLPNLPPTALIRNLGKLTSVGLLKPLSSATKLVYDTLTNTERLKGVASIRYPF